MATARVTIVRYTGSREGVHIDITDDISRTRFVSVDMDLESFARVITGQGEIHAEMETRGLDLVGKVAENKTVLIACEPPYGDKKKLAIAQEAVRACEVDGWKAQRGDIENSHNYVHGTGINVVFFPACG